jgi:hypothetical protein
MGGSGRRKRVQKHPAPTSGTGVWILEPQIGSCQWTLSHLSPTDREAGFAAVDKPYIDHGLSPTFCGSSHFPPEKRVTYTGASSIISGRIPRI